ncbi:Hypothetical protein CUL131002_0190 [Corynebacterium ulcerans]|nr:Hypothetical protein CUL131002_0190 [Corynebacterium ulcerans]
MGYAMWQDFAWRLSRELPQGRNAARVSGLWRVCGVPFLYLQPLPLKQHLLSESARCKSACAVEVKRVRRIERAPNKSPGICGK